MSHTEHLNPGGETSSESTLAHHFGKKSNVNKSKYIV